jgi:hypothetical protein
MVREKEGRQRPRNYLWVGVLVLSALAAGCPAEDEPGEDTVAYCAQAEALDEQQDPPTGAQLESLRAAAPAEIEPDVGIVVERYAEAGMDAFQDPEVAEARERLEAWEADNCP